MKKIGKGAFTTAYLTTDNKVLLKSMDPIKECMALGWFPTCYLFPTVENTDQHNEFIMEYYPKVSSLKSNLSPRQWRLYKALRNLEPFQGKNKHMAYNHWWDQFGSLHSEFRNEKEMLQEALTAASNCGSDIAFEISPRNVATKNNKLVLLDCFFSISTLQMLSAQEIK